MRDGYPMKPTFTGKRVNPLAMTVDDIDIRDIAHHLATINRFTGACARPYSVAQHSVYVSNTFGGNQLAKLLHDAPEAYLGDLDHNLKYHSPIGMPFIEAEDRLARVIEEKFGLEAGALDDPSVKVADEEIFDMEWKVLVDGNGIIRSDRLTWEWHRAENRFLERFVSLKGTG